MKPLLFAIALVGVATAAQARCDRYGNCYYGGQGYNPNTGSSWNYGSHGSNTYGTDSRGNAWNYNAGSNVYQNYGTGRTCTGTGAYRSCY